MVSSSNAVRLCSRFRQINNKSRLDIKLICATANILQNIRSDCCLCVKEIIGVIEVCMWAASTAGLFSLWHRQLFLIIEHQFSNTKGTQLKLDWERSTVMSDQYVLFVRCYLVVFICFHLFYLSREKIKSSSKMKG